MGAPVKFLFEDDFAGGGAAAKSVIPLAQYEAQLALHEAQLAQAQRAKDSENLLDDRNPSTPS